MRRPLSKWTLLAVLFGTLILADQWTKFLAVERLTYAFDRAGDVTLAEKLRGFYAYRHLEQLAKPPHYVYRPLWRMSYVENPGAAWGLFRNLPAGFRNVLFGVISVAAAAFIFHTYRRARTDQRFLQVALAFVLTGAMGNFVDRVARRYVIDFVEWYWWNRPDIRWPTFNVADSLIVVGVAMLLVHPGSGKERVEPAGDGGEGADRAA
ncbi:MAG TPA: signal peptidase II [Anaeromyxobacteraceae bacterium]|nr:signal peptidase II [Anaeromyxobacteraceae bacterium]